MIWTVILKDGKSFVVVGSSPSFNHEIRRSLVARSVEEKDVAAVVKGNHPVLEFPSTMPISRWGDYSDQRRSAMAAPTIRDRDTKEELSDVVYSNEVDLSNDPIDW